MPSVFDNPFVLPIIIIGIVGFVAWNLFKKKGMPFKDFKFTKSDKTIHDELKKKCDNFGNSAKQSLFKSGTLYRGYKKIARIDKYLITKGKFAFSYYDPQENTIKIDESQKPKTYNLLILRAKSNSLIWRTLGLKKQYFILKFEDNGKEIIKFDHKENRFFLPWNMELSTYGDVWLNSADGEEYISDILSAKRNERIEMQLLNIPDRVVHLDLEQAKKERTGRAFMELERAKYDAIKKAEDTVIE